MPPPAKSLPELHELEAEVMNLVWEQGTTTVRAVLAALNASSTKARAYTTVMTTMARLADKGFLGRVRRGKTDVYEPTIDRAVYLQQRAQVQVDALVDEYGELALVNFARRMDTLDPARRARLLRLARDEES